MAGAAVTTALRRPPLPAEYVALMMRWLEGHLAEAVLRRLQTQAANPALRPAAVFWLEREVQAVLGVDPRNPPGFVNPAPALLPQDGEIVGPRVVRGAGAGDPVLIPATSAMPAAGFVGQNRRGKSWAAYALADQYLDRGCAAVAFDHLDGGWTRAAARRGPGRGRVLHAREWLFNPLQPEPGETSADAVGRLKAVLRPLWLGPNMLGALERLVADVATALATTTGAIPCLEDVWQRLETAPARALGKSAEARDTLRDRLQGVRAQLLGLFQTREGMPVCRLLDPGVLTVFHLQGLNADNIALFGRVVDAALEAHLRAHEVHRAG